MFDMKILCAFYICLMFTLEGARLTPAPWQQQQHLSRKLNREAESPPLEPAGEHHHQPGAAKDCDLYSRRRQSPARCLRRADKLPDRAVEHAASRQPHLAIQPAPPSLRKLLSVVWQPKREVRFHLHHPGRDRRMVIMPRRSGFGRRGPRHRRRRRKRKRKRSQQPAEVVVTRPNTSVPSPGPAPITATAPNVAQAHSTSKDSDTSGNIIFAVTSCLLALLVSGILLFYLYRKSPRKSVFDPFYCPPEMGEPHQEYNQSDVEGCTCCSSERRGAPSSSVSRHQEPKKQQQQRATKPVKKVVQPKKKTTTTTKPKKKKSTITTRKPPAKQPPPFSETELREIQSRIACILRRDCGRCNCCRCNALDDDEQPRHSSNKFKLFRMKKNKPSAAAAALCNDARCDENKIRCLVNLCRASDTAGLRIKQ